MYNAIVPSLTNIARNKSEILSKGERKKCAQPLPTLQKTFTWAARWILTLPTPAKSPLCPVTSRLPSAVNEKGLGIAGLNFVGNAAYAASGEDKPNIAQYELIPWLLGTCTTVKEGCEALTSVHLTGTPFNENYPTASLHWLLADKNKAVVVEHTADGLHIYENSIGVMTNNPPFPQQMANLARYRGLSPHQPQGDFAAAMGLPEYSRGLGTHGLPGGLSSDARFVRVAFTRNNAISGDSEEESVGGFFHILGTVDQVRGCCEVTPGNFEITIYSSCWNADRGIYYYTTYKNPQITAVDMHRADLDGSELTGYPLLPIEIHKQN